MTWLDFEGREEGEQDGSAYLCTYLAVYFHVLETCEEGKERSVV